MKLNILTMSKVSLMELPDQRDLIEDKNWDNILFLDAMRFDYFEKLYPEYLKGELTKTWNGGLSLTYEWFKRNIRKYFDACLFFAVPLIMEKYWKPNTKESWDDKKFDWEEHFADFCPSSFTDWWDHELLTCTCEKVNQAVRGYETLVEKKFIRYLSPHFPHVGEFRVPYACHHDMDFSDDDRAIGQRLREEYEKGSYTAEEFQKSYESNCRVGLEAVCDIIPELQGKTIILSDHGECLWDCGRMGHGNEKMKDHDHMIHVPWFEVEGVK